MDNDIAERKKTGGFVVVIGMLTNIYFYIMKRKQTSRNTTKMWITRDTRDK